MNLHSIYKSQQITSCFLYFFKLRSFTDATSPPFSLGGWIHCVWYIQDDHLAFLSSLYLVSVKAGSKILDWSHAGWDLCFILNWVTRQIMVMAHEPQSSADKYHIHVVSSLSLMKEDRSISFLTRQAMYEQCNIEVRSHYHRCSGKTINITYNVCVWL